MLRAKLTFDEAMGSRSFSIMSRQRLQMIRRDLYKQLDALQLTGHPFGEVVA